MLGQKLAKTSRKVGNGLKRRQTASKTNLRTTRETIETYQKLSDSEKSQNQIGSNMPHAGKKVGKARSNLNPRLSEHFQLLSARCVDAGRFDFFCIISMFLPGFPRQLHGISPFPSFSYNFQCVFGLLLQAGARPGRASPRHGLSQVI